MGQQGPPGAKKKEFFKNDPGPHGMPKQVFLARFELVVARFGPPKIPKCLENGLLVCFSKNDPRSFGGHKQVK